MSMTHYQLLERHARLDEALRRELRRRLPDPLLTLRLKKLKLAIKDRIAARVARGAGAGSAGR
ncbi:DUF465 domain-containing protein [Sphingomonas sp. ASV193]|uniref:DUF465 domain-containing protein n=1 Tax=Sphingomonas sp. ASV193 TaxID=3144405 RepID=UPI0032E8F45A